MELYGVYGTISGNLNWYGKKGIEVAQKQSAAMALGEGEWTPAHAIKKIIDGSGTLSQIFAAAEKADVLLILTGWEDFRSLDYHKIYSNMSNPCIVDSHNLLDAKTIVDIGFKYSGVGAIIE